MCEMENTENNEEIKIQRTRNWSEMEIKQMLQVALDININSLFDTKCKSALQIYKDVQEKLNIDDITAAKIQLKFTKLRRNYTNVKAAGKKSGAGGIKSTIYDSEMDALWGFRPKFLVPQKYGNDSSKEAVKKINEKRHQDEESERQHEETERQHDEIESQDEDNLPQRSQSPETTQHKVENLNQIHEVLEKKKKRGRPAACERISNIGNMVTKWMAKSEERENEMMAKLEEMEKNSDKKADERLEKMMMFFNNQNYITQQSFNQPHQNIYSQPSIYTQPNIYSPNTFFKPVQPDPAYLFTNSPSRHLNTASLSTATILNHNQTPSSSLKTTHLKRRRINATPETATSKNNHIQVEQQIQRKDDDDVSFNAPHLKRHRVDAIPETVISKNNLVQQQLDSETEDDSSFEATHLKRHFVDATLETSTSKNNQIQQHLESETEDELPYGIFYDYEDSE